ncbi:nucleoside phosphorylase domain-containing protein [Aspergillus varians]
MACQPRVTHAYCQAQPFATLLHASHVTLAKEDYYVACITVIPEEFAAFSQIFQVKHRAPLNIDKKDPNQYQFGEIAGHNVVLGTSGTAGPHNAAETATNLKRSFHGIIFALLVGIGGGVPSSTCDIRLGDVVVAAGGRQSRGITHHDFGKQLTDDFIQLDFSTASAPRLQSAVCAMEAINILSQSKIPHTISDIVKRAPAFSRPDDIYDQLFEPTFEHIAGSVDCDRCAEACPDKRAARHEPIPCIHYGPIASGSQVVKSAIKREELRRRYDVRCIEMEAAGVARVLPSLVIRGISDYADSHKNDHWKRYAALAASAYAKELLARITPFNAIPSSTASAIGYSVQPVATQPHGPALVNLLDQEARRIKAQNWRESLVDLLKALGLRWDQTSRDMLAEALQISDGASGSAKRNNALRRALMERLTIEDGRVIVPSFLQGLRY